VFGGEWFHTKDAARQDDDGYVCYEGRADDVIIAAGYRIGPFEVESACLEHPAVREAAAIASPDELRGNVVKAFIVLAPDYEPSDELAEEIKTFVRDRLSAYAYPRRIEFVADLPKTLTGKIRRIVLRQLELERMQSVRGEHVRLPPATELHTIAKSWSESPPRAPAAASSGSPCSCPKAWLSRFGGKATTIRAGVGRHRGVRGCSGMFPEGVIGSPSREP
jgi:long-subunit acyl-CoA synthetase (AMP-forming)